MRKLLFVLLLIIAFVSGLLFSWSTKPFETKKRTSPFTIMAVDDPSLVHIRRGTTALYTDYDYDPSDLFCWQFHLPQRKQWNLCWAFGEFPRDGSPAIADGTHALASTEVDENPEFDIRFGGKDGNWIARFGYGDMFRGPIDTWSVSVPAEQGPAIKQAENSFIIAAGEESKTKGWIAQIFTGEKPIVILRLGNANMDGFNRHAPYNGILVWLEQSSDRSKQVPSETESPRVEPPPP